MKNLRKVLILLTAVVSYNLSALEAPKPISGFPSISSRSTVLSVGDMVIKIAPPPKWGIGETSISRERTSTLSLFPEDGSHGCSVQIDRYADEASATQAVEKLKRTFQSTIAVNNGFEAELKKAWYSCKVNDACVIQIWYSLPKKKSNSQSNWQSLKDCISIESLEPKVTDSLDPNRPAVEKTRLGWVCHHPENKVDVFFRIPSFAEASGNEDPSKLYSVQFSDFTASGYFYVKWDQKEVTEETFANFLNEMLLDIKGMEPTQKVSGKGVINMEQQHAFLKGSPYTIVTVPANDDGFLIGFAMKQSLLYSDINWDDYIKKVTWTVHQPKD